MTDGALPIGSADNRFVERLRLLDYVDLERTEFEQINQWVADGSDESLALFQSLLTRKLGDAKPFDADSWDSGKAMADLSRLTAALYRESNSGAKEEQNPEVEAAEAPHIERPPATKLVSWLEWLLPRRSYTKIVAPLVADEYHEYYAAIKGHDEKRARWIRIRMHALIAWSAFWALLAPIAKVFKATN